MKTKATGTAASRSRAAAVALVLAADRQALLEPSPPATRRCPDEETLAQLFERSLPAQRAAAIQRHVDACQHCSRLLDWLLAGELSRPATFQPVPLSALPAPLRAKSSAKPSGRVIHFPVRVDVPLRWAADEPNEIRAFPGEKRLLARGPLRVWLRQQADHALLVVLGAAPPPFALVIQPSPRKNILEPLAFRAPGETRFDLGPVTKLGGKRISLTLRFADRDLPLPTVAFQNDS